jgi:carbamoyl-phosphate synthase large subunit
VPHYGVKEAVFPFNMFPEVDPILGPEMRSTGEVLGMSRSFGLAFFKAQEATKSPLPTRGTVLITVANPEKSGVIDVARQFKRLGFEIRATRGTHDHLTGNGVEAVLINKMHEGRPNIVDAIKNREIDLVINTPVGKLSKDDDSYIRKSAIKYKVPYITTMAAAVAAARGIAAMQEERAPIKSLQEYHAGIA